MSKAIIEKITSFQAGIICGTVGATLGVLSSLYGAVVSGGLI